MRFLVLTYCEVFDVHFFFLGVYVWKQRTGTMKRTMETKGYI